jgi:hypothetical protein
MNRRDLLKSAIWSVPALFGVASCGGGSIGGGPEPGPPSPPPCPTTTRALGLSFASQKRLDGIVGAPVATQSGGGNVTSYFSLDDVNLLSRMGYGVLLPPVGNQGQQGSCVAWGVGYATSTFFAQLPSPPGPVAAPTSQASPADLYAKLLQLENSACGSGTLVADALDLMVVDGVTSFANSPYSDQVCSVPSVTGQFFLNGYTRLDPNNQALLKQHISNLSVIPLGIVVYPDFESATGSAVYSPSGANCSLGGHCIALIGYDDTRQAFRIMNSWGTGWGDSGFLWIAYDAFPSIVQEAYLPTGSFWPTPILGSGGIVSGTVSTTGSIGIGAAVVFDWNAPPNSSTPFLAFINIALNGPLLVNSVQIQYADSNPSDTVPLGNFNVLQWNRTLIFQTPLTNAQAATVFNGSGMVSITISGVSASGEQITTACQVAPTSLR